ncbi:MAG: FHA domain-containing protein [Victivallaceae bacterium]
MAYIQYKSGSARKFYQLPGRMVVFGRGEHCDFQILDKELSREHFAIQQAENGKYELIDLGSRNGTYHCGRKLLNELDVLKNGDEIYSGGHRFVFLEDIPAKTTQDIVNEMADAVDDDSKGFRTAMIEIVSEASGKS